MDETFFYPIFAIDVASLQGGLYPDVIERSPPPGSGQKHSYTIKSHRNVGGLAKDLDFTLIEPLRELFMLYVLLSVVHLSHHSITNLLILLFACSFTYRLNRALMHSFIMRLP